MSPRLLAVFARPLVVFVRPLAVFARPLAVFVRPLAGASRPPLLCFNPRTDFPPNPLRLLKQSKGAGEMRQSSAAGEKVVSVGGRASRAMAAMLA